MREVDGEHARRRVGAHVAADDRRAVDARLRVQSAAGTARPVSTRLVPSRRPSCAFDLRDRPVRASGRSSTRSAGRRGRASSSCRRRRPRRWSRIDGQLLDRVAQVAGQRPHQQPAAVRRVVVDARHHVRAAEPLRVLERRVGDQLARLEVEQPQRRSSSCRGRSRGRGWRPGPGPTSTPSIRTRSPIAGDGRIERRSRTPGSPVARRSMRICPRRIVWHRTTPSLPR